MYAITANSYRAIASAADAQPGETVVAEVPQSLIDSMAATEAMQEARGRSLRAKADAALADMRAYRNLATPTNAQTVAAVKLLCAVCIGLTRLALLKLDAED